jgi:putative methyltransferase (TIGR04325 family)
MTGVRSWARQWLPPALATRVRPWFGGIRFSGDYASWDAARAQSGGYDAAAILERVSAATREAASGSGKYERDSVLFDEPQVSWPMLAGLLAAAAESGGGLSVLDFGGSLGTSYFQCRPLLPRGRALTWSIVEQENFVDHGQRHFQTDELHFHHSIAQAIAASPPAVALLSSVLQYVPEPAAVIDALVAAAVPYLVVDRTPFVEDGGDRITVQHVPRSIYAASYPCWLFSRPGFLDRFRGYELVATFDSPDGIAHAGRVRFGFGGMILRKSC